MAPRQQQPNAKEEKDHTGGSDEKLHSNSRAISVRGLSTGGEVSLENEGSQGEFSGLSEYVLEPLNMNFEFILYRGRARLRPSKLSIVVDRARMIRRLPAARHQLVEQ